MAAIGTFKLIEFAQGRYEQAEFRLSTEAIVGGAFIEVMLGALCCARPYSRLVLDATLLVCLSVAGISVYLWLTNADGPACGCFGSLSARFEGVPIVISAAFLLLLGVAMVSRSSFEYQSTPD